MSNTAHPMSAMSADSRFCHTCQRPFVDSIALSMHCRTSKAHSMAVPAPSQSTSKPSKNARSTNLIHECKVCDKRFKDKKALRNHKQDSQKHKALLSRSKDTTAGVSLSPTTADFTTTGNEEIDTTAEELSDMSLGGVAITPTDILNGGVVPAPSTGPSVPTTPYHDEATETLIPFLTSTAEHQEETPVRGDWSFIPFIERDSLLDALQAQCHPVECLARERYWTEKPTRADIDMTRKCNHCGVMKRKLDNTSESVCRFHPAKKAFERGIIQGRGRGPSNGPCFLCEKTGRGGCISLTEHEFAPADAKLRTMEQSPSCNPDARKAVVLDCEMVGVLGTNNRETSEVVRVSAVDFLSGEVLIDTYVEPLQRVISWRSKVSGVTKSLLAEMRHQGRTIGSWKLAREAVWRFIDERTILIGQSLNNDLEALGMVHTCVVDSALMTRDAVGEDCHRFWALKTLVQQFLNREIQTGTAGHDCVEDTFAAREVVLWCLQNRDQLRVWAASELEIIMQKQKEKLKKEPEGSPAT
ncbi:ribonuclease H-like domain-containing protein [Aspergillus cavernicola]|uniref:Ribonuclease H-like domain-containing protein n=1 Tax=Aspergillus cavernicola TaxID=176166 RepID=A0ABR4IHY8_9EURO